MAGRVNISDAELKEIYKAAPTKPVPPGIIICREGTDPNAKPFQFGIKHLLWAMLLASVFFAGMAWGSLFYSWTKNGKPAQTHSSANAGFSKPFYVEFDCSVPMYSVASFDIPKLQLTGKQTEISQTPVGHRLAGVKEWASDRIRVDFKHAVPWIIIKTIDGNKHYFEIVNGQVKNAPMPTHLSHL